MKILVAGDIFVDKYTYGRVDRLAPDFTGFIFDRLRTVSFLGGAGNVAKGIKSLLPDTQVDLEGSLNEADHYLLDSVILRQSGNHSITKERFVAIGDDSPDNPRHKQKLFRVDSDTKFPPECSTKGGTISYEDYDIVVFSDYNKGTIDSVQKIVKPTVLLDSKRKNLSLFNKVDIAKVNEKEFEASKFEMSHIRDVIVTHGKKPVAYYTNGFKDVSYTPTYEVLDADVGNHDFSGAGDSFLCGLIFGLVNGYSREYCIKIGNINAAIAVSTFGTASPTERQLRDEIKRAKENGFWSS